MSDYKKPTIEELERILASKENAKINLAPDGSIFVSREIDALQSRIQQYHEALRLMQLENNRFRDQLASQKAVIEKARVVLMPFGAPSCTPTCEKECLVCEITKVLAAIAALESK